MWSKTISVVFFFLLLVPSHSPLALCAPSHHPLSPFSLVSSSRAYRSAPLIKPLESLWRSQLISLNFVSPLWSYLRIWIFFLARFFACAPSWRCKQANYANDRVAKNSAYTSSHAGKKVLLVGYCQAQAFVSRFPKLVSNKCSVPSILAALLLEAWYSVFEGSHDSRVCYTVLN